jgi:hypothetical protein
VKIEQLLYKLKERNGDLEALYRQVSRMRKKGKQKEERSLMISTNPLPKHLSQIPQVSSELYEALNQCFSCGNVSHDDHTASLSFNVQYSKALRMDVVIKYSVNCER